ncbi:MAG: hypothetical protein H6857_03210 [Rhodospirillales bacterium]|nr:hypothetical protein [Rhodospirillales bacterium]
MMKNSLYTSGVETGIHFRFWPVRNGSLCGRVAHAAISVPYGHHVEAVNVTVSANCPRIAVTVDGQTRYAEYSAGTGHLRSPFYAPTVGDLIWMA